MDYMRLARSSHVRIARHHHMVIGMPLSFLLQILPRQGCHNAPDRVYSILGLAAKGADISVDYGSLDVEFVLSLLKACRDMVCYRSRTPENIGMVRTAKIHEDIFELAPRGITCQKRRAMGILRFGCSYASFVGVHSSVRGTSRFRRILRIRGVEPCSITSIEAGGRHVSTGSVQGNCYAYDAGTY